MKNKGKFVKFLPQVFMLKIGFQCFEKALVIYFLQSIIEAYAFICLSVRFIGRHHEVFSMSIMYQELRHDMF